jgi:hypothetical protein
LPIFRHYAIDTLSSIDISTFDFAILILFAAILIRHYAIIAAFRRHFADVFIIFDISLADAIASPIISFSIIYDAAFHFAAIDTLSLMLTLLILLIDAISPLRHYFDYASLFRHFR